MKVFVTGASGYVGTAVVKKLLERGHEVIALQRTRKTGINHRQLSLVSGDITERDSLAGVMAGCEAVIHLVGIIREIPGKNITMQRIHVEGTRNVIAEAQTAGVKRFLHMSALGSRPGAVSSYHQSKWAAEEIVRQSGLAYTIFRPSVIFGKGGPGPNFVAQLADLVRKAPLVPVIGDGSFQLQPVSSANVAEGFARGLETNHTLNKVYEVGGPECLSYLKILEMVAEAQGKKLHKIHLPVGLMKFLVPLLQNVPGFPLTQDQLLMLLEGNICEDWQTYYRDFGIEPERFQLYL